MSQTPNIRLRGLRSPGFPSGYLLGRIGQGAGEVQPLSLQHLRGFGLASRGDLAAVRFIDLKDAPHDYTTFAGALVQVNTDEDAVVFSVVKIAPDGRVTTVTDPTGPQDAATKAYVDAAIAGVPTGITQLTGDVTAGPGSGSQAATLSTTGVAAATYGDATHVGQFTVDATGRITLATNVAIIGGDVLDDISTTPGAMLFRGTMEWDALAPGTPGQFITLIDTSTWSPLDLGSKLKAWWKPPNPGTNVTLNGSGIASWTDEVGGNALAQATAGNQPLYTATGYDGNPGAVFDGTDDYLALAPVPAGIPTGSSPSELWTSCRQDALAADTTGRALLSIGGSSGASRRQTLRQVSGGVNQVAVAAAGSISGGIGDLSGYHVVRGICSTIVQAELDGVADISASATQATTTTRVALGTNSALFSAWQGAVREVLVTEPLTSGEAASLLAYLEGPTGGLEPSWTDLSSTLDTALVAGTNMTITNNGDGTFTFASSGGGGSGGSYAPLVTGAEPAALVSNGAGALIMVAYTP